jgi:cell cycle arrest protein BUB2
MVTTVAQESFEHLLKKGPPNGDMASGLDELRYKILIDGIPSNSDGMVCPSCCNMSRFNC